MVPPAPSGGKASRTRGLLGRSMQLLPRLVSPPGTRGSARKCGSGVGQPGPGAQDPLLRPRRCPRSHTEAPGSVRLHWERRADGECRECHDEGAKLEQLPPLPFWGNVEGAGSSGARSRCWVRGEDARGGQCRSRRAGLSVPTPRDSESSSALPASPARFLCCEGLGPPRATGRPSRGLPEDTDAYSPRPTSAGRPPSLRSPAVIIDFYSR